MTNCNEVRNRAKNLAENGVSYDDIIRFLYDRCMENVITTEQGKAILEEIDDSENK